MRAFVAVSGLPASGKTTLASAIAKALLFPHFDKDHYLESLFDLEGKGNPQRRRDLSVRADMQFRDAALSADRAVLSSWWRHPKSAVDSGTPIAWLLQHDRALVEIHCVCSAQVAAARFAARTRHPGHLDNSRFPDAMIGMFKQQEHFGPIFPGRAFVVDAEKRVVIPDLIAAVQGALRQQHATLSGLGRQA